MPSPDFALSAASDRLLELVPPAPGPNDGAVDQRALFDALASLVSAVHHASDATAVKNVQRGLEDALLRVTCGGWAGPAVRRSAAEVLSALFTVGEDLTHELNRRRTADRAQHAAQRNTRRFAPVHVSCVFSSLFSTPLGSMSNSSTRPVRTL